MYIEKVRAQNSQFSYTDDMNMHLLAVVIPPSIYHGFSTRKTFWEGKFAPVNMKFCGRRNFRKHRDIKDGDKYTTLDVSSDFVSLDDMKITSSEPKYYLGRSGEGLIISLGLKTIRRSNKNKN